jgi:hypothetical protein
MYRKWKTISTPQVDVEELKRHMRREVLGDLRHILEAQGIQFSDIGGVMSDEEHRSSFASTTRGEQPWGEHQCDRTTSKMRGLSPKIISGDSRRSENA